MKHLFTFLAALALGLSAAAQPTSRVAISDPDSLPIIFGDSSKAAIATLTDKSFYAYWRALDYSLNNTGPGSIAEWESPQHEISGSVTVKEEPRPGCKLFQQKLNLSSWAFDGSGIACLEDKVWTIERPPEVKKPPVKKPVPKRATSGKTS